MEIFGMISGVFTMIFVITIILTIVSMWIIYKKAGKGGWESIVPIYSNIVLLEIVGLPIWYIALFFVPLANIYAMFKMYIELAHKFGKSTGFGVATVFFGIICLPILAFDKSCTYNGANNFDNQPMRSNRSIEIPNYEQMEKNNNTNNNNPHIETPIVFNPNVNTNLNQVQNNLNNNIQNIGTPNPNPMENNINPQPTPNVSDNNDESEEQGFQYNVPTEVQPPLEIPVTNNNPQPINQDINIIQQPIPQPVQNAQINPIIQPQSPVTAPVEQTLNNQMNNGFNPQPINQNIYNTVPTPVENTAPTPTLNVIPNMGATPTPQMPQQNNINNQNM